MVKNGLRTHIGAHGEAPLGVNYHAEMSFTGQGGLSNYEVLVSASCAMDGKADFGYNQVFRAATVDAAVTLGIHDALGSLSEGKLADFVVYLPGIDILTDDIKVSRNIRYVARGGRLWDASTMVEEWPTQGRRAALPPINAD